MARGAGGGGGAGRGGGSRGRAPLDRDTQISKKLSWLLRHGAESEGLQLGEGGYISLASVLENRKVKSLKVSLDDVRRVVAENAKQRFALVHVDHKAVLEQNSLDPSSSASDVVSAPAQTADDKDVTNWLIRANQGHSLKVDDAELLKPITLEADNVPAVVVHGTRREHWPKIVASGGLKPMTRNHVHFATGVPEQLQKRRGGAQTTAAEADVSAEDDDVAELPEKKNMPLTLSGMRGSSSILMFLDPKKALDSGLKLGLSDNGVVLSEGNEQSIVPLDLFETVEEVGGNILVRGGKVVAELVDRKK